MGNRKLPNVTLLFTQYGYLQLSPFTVRILSFLLTVTVVTVVYYLYYYTIDSKGKVRTCTRTRTHA